VTDTSLNTVPPEEESKYRMVEAQQEEYGWRSAIIDVGDYLVIFIRIDKPEGRTFVLRLRCDDYPEVAPELRFMAPEVFDNPSEDAAPEAQVCPIGESMVAAGQRGPFPVPCIKGHREYSAGGWHTGWSNPPAHDHSLYQLVMNVRNAILDRWS
jgi:hypothetical protein